MLAMRIFVLMIHVSAAAFLFGGSAAVARPLRRTLELGGQAFAIAAEDAVRRVRHLGISSMVTMMTGVGLMLLTYGSFGAAPKNFHAGLGLMILAVATSFAVLRPSIRAVGELSRTDQLDRDKIRPLLKKIAAGQGVMHLLWVAILLLMFVRF